MEKDIKAVCVRATDYGEADKLLTLASFELGKITVKARGARRANAKLKGGCMPMAFGDFSVSEGKTGFVLTGINIEESFYSCWSDVTKNLAAMYVLEILEKSSMPEADIREEILLTLNALKEINYGEVYPFAICCKYAVHMLELAGEQAENGEFLPAEIKRLIKIIRDLEFDELGSLDIGRTKIDDLLSFLNIFLAGTLDIKLKIYGEIVNMLRNL